VDYSTYSHPVFDSDQHFYETEESFTRYLPKKYAGVVRYVTVDGRTKIALHNRISNYIPNPTFEVVAAPGSGMEYFSGKNTSGKSFRELVTPMRRIPAFQDPDARLAFMDEAHIDTILNFPTLASVIEVNFMDDPELSIALVHAFNQWMHDQWSFNYQDRIYSTPVINLSTCEGAIRELDWVMERGAKAVLVRPAPVAGSRGSRSPFLPEFDPFWEKLEQAAIPLCHHVSNSGYHLDASRWIGPDAAPEWLAFEPDAFSMLVMHDRPIIDTIFSAIAHGMLSRFQGIKLLTLECGSGWVPRVIEDLAYVYGRVPQQFAENPADVFKRQVYVNPFWEDPLKPLVDIIGVDHVLFASDWPHPEGLADPAGWAEYCRREGFGDSDVAKMMGGNMYGLVGVSPVLA
jgi:predicted TIM-barrel fold metal-dependent hydrolase